MINVLTVGPQRVWRKVFFSVVVYTILIIVQEVLQATGHSCSTTKKGKRGQIIVREPNRPFPLSRRLIYPRLRFLKPSQWSMFFWQS